MIAKSAPLTPKVADAAAIGGARPDRASRVRHGV